MRRQLDLFFLLFGICCPMLASTPAWGDVFMKSKHHSDAYQMMGQNQPARDFIKTVWMGQDRVRHDLESTSMIVRLDAKVMYMLDHAKKSYREVPLDPEKAFGIIPEAKNMPEEQRKKLKGMMQEMAQMRVSVVATSENKKISGWNCTKYMETMHMVTGPAESEVWATEDLKMDHDLFANVAAAMAILQPGGKEAAREITEEMKKIKGVPVLTVTTADMMGAKVKSTEELIEFKEENAPAGIYEIPPGYTRKSMSN